MSKITNPIAESVADQLVALKASSAQTKMNGFAGSIRTKYMNTLPESVRTAFDQNPEFFAFNTAKSIRVDVPGVGTPDIDVEPFPVYSRKPSVGLDGKTDSALISAYQDAKIEVDQVNALKAAVKECLLKLRTYANVEAFFPEAVTYLPDAPAAPVAEDVDAIRTALGFSATPPTPASRVSK